MLQFLKKLFARKELEELKRWRTEWEEHRKCFSEFKDVAIVLDHLRLRVYKVGETPSIHDQRLSGHSELVDKQIKAFVIVENARGESWLGYHETDPKLGTHMPTDSLEALNPDIKPYYYDIEEAQKGLRLINQYIPNGNYEICPVYE